MMPRPPGSSLSYPLCPYPTLCRSGHDGLEQREQRGAVLLAVEPCDRVERRALHRQAVRLLILDHLEPVLNPPQHRIMIGQPRRDVGGDPSRLCKRRERRSEEHTSELQSLMRISYAVFCLNKK